MPQCVFVKNLCNLGSVFFGGLRMTQWRSKHVALTIYYFNVDEINCFVMDWHICVFHIYTHTFNTPSSWPYLEYFSVLLSTDAHSSGNGLEHSTRHIRFSTRSLLYTMLWLTVARLSVSCCPLALCAIRCIARIFSSVAVSSVYPFIEVSFS